jgi:hypothetical protein
MGGDVPESGTGGQASSGRAPVEKRTYNRRTPTPEASPPYFDVFSRIATALEGIERALQQRIIDVDAGRPAAEAAAEAARRGSAHADGFEG